MTIWGTCKHSLQASLLLSACHIEITMFQDSKSKKFLTSSEELAGTKQMLEELLCIEVKPQNPKRQNTIDKFFITLCSVSTIGSFCTRTTDGFISLATQGTKGIFAPYCRGVSIRCMRDQMVKNPSLLSFSHAAVM